ncbi:hypothetical protein OPFAMLBM_00013 [Aeromonas phage avDM12-TAAL]|nr:hypothetical protein OPFAMLBM_00013 [Aeromonas phage avDM12-TAAL]
MKQDTIVVIPSREMDGATGCLSFERMLKEKKAQGFIGAVDRLATINHIAIVDKGNKAYFADIIEIYSGTDAEKQLNTNDIYFDNVRPIPLSALKEAGINVNSGRCSIRYAALANIVANLKKEDTELLSLFG